ncbi:hypothetical protein ADK41_32125 [Streptomyces caelestis]|uniref:Uncharacterized protein n=1 Tax=Streptomyces caelestis TaxID=36816 RepID=A0A0N0S526_9ACTN|nr:hypothetical protein ADK41_32125 [Streptomyces caelestis]
MAGQQDERAGVREVQNPLKAGEESGQSRPQPVDGAGTVRDQARSPTGEDRNRHRGDDADAGP